MNIPNHARLLNINWGEEWKELQDYRDHSDNSSYWDKRSKSYKNVDGHSKYADEFLELSNIEPNSKVFDMGCGTGAISIPLAEAGNDVIAADFSGGMLEKLKADIKDRKLNNIETVQMSWSDNWDNFGITENSVDVAVASRSIATDDLEKALFKLDKVAREKACITITTGHSPKVDAQAMTDLGIMKYAAKDFIYVINILVQHEIFPKLDYIVSEFDRTYNSRDDIYDAYVQMVDKLLPSKDSKEYKTTIEKLSNWIDDKLIANPNAGEIDRKGKPQGKYKLDHARKVTWAFISWNTNR